MIGVVRVSELFRVDRLTLGYNSVFGEEYLGDDFKWDEVGRIVDDSIRSGLHGNIYRLQLF